MYGNTVDTHIIYLYNSMELTKILAILSIFSKFSENISVIGSTVVKVTFKNSKTKKTTTKKYRCVVKAEKKVDEAYKITSASATGVKTITVELNKDITNAASLSAVVKKGTAKRESKFTVEGSKVIIAMDAKLTAGAYTVTLEGLEATALTADLTVEKDETLTTFEIADYIVAKSAEATTTGTIRFAALNQYGEKMATSNVTPTCSFGDAKIDKYPSATAEGKIEVTGINPVLAIVGTKGTIVVVGDMGVNATKEISYNVAATASTVEIAGTYQINSATMKSITEGDTISNYELLFSIKDQYGYAMSADEVSGELQIPVAGGLTGIKVSNANPDLTTRTVDGVDYVAMKLEGDNQQSKAKAGDVTINIVNPRKGLLLTSTLTVAKSVVIKNINITADNGIYWGQDNELNYEIVDADGKSVTSYAVLAAQGSGLDLKDTGMRLERNADGSAKLIYNAQDAGLSNPNQGTTTDKASTPFAVTVKANEPAGGDFLVKTFSFTLYQQRYVKGIIGLAAGTETSVALKANKALEIPSTKIVLADQYSNSVTSSEEIFNKVISGGAIDVTGTSIKVVSNGAVDVTIVDNNKMVVSPQAVGTATVYMKYNYEVGKTVEASAQAYDAKFTISVYDTTGVDVNGLQIKEVNNGFAVATQAAIDLAVEDITVVAKVGGVETKIPYDQYKIVKNENNRFTDEEIAQGKQKKTATVTVQVTTWDSNNTNIETQISKEYEVSREDRKLFKVTGTVDAATEAAINASSSALSLSSTDFVKYFKFRDQFGCAEDTAAGLGIASKAETYKISYVSCSADADKSAYRISSSGLNSATLTFDAEKAVAGSSYKFKITVTTPDGSSKDCTVTVTISRS